LEVNRNYVEAFDVYVNDELVSKKILIDEAQFSLIETNKRYSYEMLKNLF
jgi:hypothetical protein